jgi:hypothetical protein
MEYITGRLTDGCNEGKGDKTHKDARKHVEFVKRRNVKDGGGECESEEKSAAPVSHTKASRTMALCFFLFLMNGSGSCASLKRKFEQCIVVHCLAEPWRISNREQKHNHCQCCKSDTQI